ncbi:DNA-binding GntR family transcriptional regulator [Bradyrhizobium diazoefficiens]
MTRRPAKAGSIARGAGVALGEAVFRSLCEALQAGSYRAGDRLREEEVAQRLKVSRTPVREALGRLAARGFVEPAGGRGLIVRNLDISEVLELYAMREIMEGAAARLAAEHASATEIDALRDIEQTFVEAPATDAIEMARLNRAFHEAICRAARNLQRLPRTTGLDRPARPDHLHGDGTPHDQPRRAPGHHRRHRRTRRRQGRTACARTHPRGAALPAQIVAEAVERCAHASTSAATAFETSRTSAGLSRTCKPRWPPLR